MKTMNLIAMFLFGSIVAVHAQPAAPTLTASPANPSGLDDVALTGSAADNLAKVSFELAADAAFTKPYLVFENTAETIEDGQSLTEFVVDNDRFPFNIPVFIRAQYEDSNGNSSEFSNVVEVVMGYPSNLNLIYENDFESVPVDEIPEGWEVFNTTTDTGAQGSYYNPELMQWVVKDVEFLTSLVYYPSYSEPSTVETEFLIADGHTLIADSGNYVDAQNFYETHIITHEFDFTGVTDIVLAFNSNYVQNQDNIAILEYTLNDGSIDINDGAGLSALPIGDWYPIMYYLDVQDMVYNDAGDVEIFLTLDGTDDKGFTWRDYIFADENPDVGEEAIANYILPRLDDALPGPGVNGEYDSKRWERFRVPGLDNQPSVKFRLAYQGSWSWFWSIDNFQIWGDNGEPVAVSDWSLY